MPEDDTKAEKAAAKKAAETSRRRRRGQFLTDLAEAQHLRERVAPRRARMARLRQQQLMRTFLQ